MSPNESDEEHNNLSEVDDETDVYFIMQAYEYHEQLRQEETQPRLPRNLIHHDREGAEERLMADYFDDHFQPDATGRMSLSVIMKCASAIRQLAYDNSPDAFDEYLEMRMLGSIDCANNDINVLDNLPLFIDLLEDIALLAPFVGTDIQEKDKNRSQNDKNRSHENGKIVRSQKDQVKVNKKVKVNPGKWHWKKH
ncbi:hypothetical protein Tco_0400765 [Tanacetum coccineum]